MSTLKELLGWNFAATPNRNSIENRVKKSGYAVYKEPSETIKEGDYAMIIDESMMIGSEKMLLTLGVKSEKDVSGATSHKDVEVLDMKVGASWNSENIKENLTKTADKIGHSPRYVISDNASSITKAVGTSGYTHIRDASHTLGMFMECIYKNDEEFQSFMKEVYGVKFRQVMNLTAYLLPPKQRTVARFLNLSGVTDWAYKMLRNFTKLNEGEQKIFSFVPRYASFIQEMKDVLTCVNNIQKEIKTNGISHKTRHNNLCHIKRLTRGNERMIRLAEEITGYIKTETGKIDSNEKSCWNASSDIIESLFGTYKLRKAANPLYGVTPFVLLLPLHTRIYSKENGAPLDFKRSLEQNFLSDIKEWEKTNLTENLAVKRTKILQSA